MALLPISFTRIAKGLTVHAVEPWVGWRRRVKADLAGLRGEQALSDKWQYLGREEAVLKARLPPSEIEPRLEWLSRLRRKLVDQFLDDCLQSGRGLKVKTLKAKILDKAFREAVKAAWNGRRARLIAKAAVQGEVAWDKILPRSKAYGASMDERVLEVPLALAHFSWAAPRRILDAGASMNHGFIHDLLRGKTGQVVHLTQSMQREPALFEGDRYSYFCGDLRRLDFKDATFDLVLSLSTLEHLGQDNRRYGGPKEEDGEGFLGAFRELLRVLAPGGRLMVTVPYGDFEDQGWFRVFTAPDIAAMKALAPGWPLLEKYFHYDGFWYEGTSRVEVPRSPVVSAREPVRGVAALSWVKPAVP